MVGDLLCLVAVVAPVDVPSDARKIMGHIDAAVHYVPDVSSLVEGFEPRHTIKAYTATNY